MKSESTNEGILNKIDELNSSIFDRIDEVKALASCEATFSCDKIIKKCQQINILLNQIEVLKEFVGTDDQFPDHLKSTPCMN